MTIPDLATYLARVRNPHRVPFNKATAGGFSTAIPSTTWTYNPGAGIAPTTPVAPTHATAGALGLRSDGNLRLVQASVVATIMQVSDTRDSQSYENALVLCDRLSHQAGLAGNTNAVQTTNLPTAALTRYVTGEGVMMGIEIYTGLGATRLDVTIVYTNQAGVAGQTVTVVSIPASLNAGAFVICPLADGDSGVRAVASVQIVGATGSAGNFGITLFKPLAILPAWAPPRIVRSGLDSYIYNMPQIAQDACLWCILSQRAASSRDYFADLAFARD